MPFAAAEFNNGFAPGTLHKLPLLPSARDPDPLILESACLEEGLWGPPPGKEADCFTFASGDIFAFFPGAAQS